MRTLSFAVPGNPLSVNRAWRIVAIRGHGTLTLTKEARVFKAAVAAAASAALGVLPKWDGPTRVDLVVVYDSRRPDLDGPIKLALDALQGFKLKGAADRTGGCIVNDRQITDLRVRRELDRANPRLEVAVHFLDEDGTR
jgi:Holliday junction resolvase RusA-like endonuclease